MKYTRKIRLDRIGSSTVPAKIGPIVDVSPEIVPEEGAIIVGRALRDKRVYGEIELPNGRMARIVRGNIVAGVLGARQALHGYMGHVPDTLERGQPIAILNVGGVLGQCDMPNKDLGPPIHIEVFGQASREGKLLNIRDYALPTADELDPNGCPLVLILGTCMNSGKTFAAAEIIRVLSHRGVKVAAGKLSGVAALRDLLKMADNGAMDTASFLDCGLPSTVLAKDLGGVARSVVTRLEKSSPDVIILELGDGILGGYNTDGVLMDAAVRGRTRARVLCANDLVGAWGGKRLLDQMEHGPDVMSGPVTDNAVGTGYIERELGVTSVNARLDPEELALAVAKAAGIELTEAGT